jgi:hypothetical protein
MPGQAKGLVAQAKNSKTKPSRHFQQSVPRMKMRRLLYWRPCDLSDRKLNLQFGIATLTSLWIRDPWGYGGSKQGRKAFVAPRSPWEASVE